MRFLYYTLPLVWSGIDTDSGELTLPSNVKLLVSPGSSVVILKSDGCSAEFNLEGPRASKDVLNQVRWKTEIGNLDPLKTCYESRFLSVDNANLKGMVTSRIGGNKCWVSCFTTKDSTKDSKPFARVELRRGESPCQGITWQEVCPKARNVLEVLENHIPDVDDEY